MARHLKALSQLGERETTQTEKSNPNRLQEEEERLMKLTEEEEAKRRDKRRKPRGG